MGFRSLFPFLGTDVQAAGQPHAHTAPEAPGHPLSRPGPHEIRALAGDGQTNPEREERHGANSGAGQRTCKRPGCTAPITGTHLQLCAAHEDEYLDLFLDTERAS